MYEGRHAMRVAKLSPRIAKRMGLSSNHHARVWCDCMDDGINDPGKDSARPMRDVLNDPRRLGAWDAIGVIDLRVANSALDLFRQHINQEKKAS